MAAGAVCKCLLRQFGIQVLSHVVEMGGIRAKTDDLTPTEIVARAEESPVRCADPVATQAIVTRVDEARGRGTSLGGVFEVQVLNTPMGLGSYVHWDHRLDGRLAQALMSIQAIKGVEIGLGFEISRRFGSEVQDEIFYQAPGAGGAAGEGFYRQTNFGGGLEGGMTNGEPVVVRAAMKPIPTQSRPLRTVTVDRFAPATAHRERSDVCAVPAASVVAEAMTAVVLADAFLEKFGGDAMCDILYNYKHYLRRICGE